MSEHTYERTAVEVVDPIILNSRVHEPEEICGCCCCCDDVPTSVVQQLHGTLHDHSGRYLTVSLGLFSVVRIVRPAQYLVQATEYCVPDKECVSAEQDDPCALFRTMAFPNAEFCPPGFPSHRIDGIGGGGKCGCRD